MFYNFLWALRGFLVGRVNVVYFLLLNQGSDVVREWFGFRDGGFFKGAGESIGDDIR